MKKLLIMAAASGMALAAATPAAATILVPGATNVPFSAFDSSTRGTLLASSSTNEQDSDTPTYNANFRSAVYRNTAGTLDFYFQVAVNSINVNDEIFNLTASNFFGFTVDALVDATDFDGAGIFTAANNPNTNPNEPAGSTTTASRNGSGSVVRADFGANGLEAAGQTSATYIFRTNAANFATTGGTFTTQDGSVASRVNFTPVGAPVPEPATWAMMIAGFGLVGGVMRRRKTSVAFA